MFGKTKQNDKQDKKTDLPDPSTLGKQNQSQVQEQVQPQVQNQQSQSASSQPAAGTQLVTGNQQQTDTTSTTVTEQAGDQDKRTFLTGPASTAGGDQPAQAGQPVSPGQPGQLGQPGKGVAQGPASVQISANEYTMDRFLSLAHEQNASDLHLTVDYPPIIRIDGRLQTVGAENLTQEQVKKLVYDILSSEQRELFEVNKEVDLAISHKDVARFRVNVFTEKGRLAAAFRLIPAKIRSLEELKLPKKLHDFTKIEQGLVLVTGPTGHGKSTTLAGMLQEINSAQDRHIVTIEDPIEYIYPKGRSLVHQRELHEDTHSWEVALRSVLREDPDVVMVGEMRDFETIAATLTVAETGHLVFATLHTNSAAQSIDRVIDVFPPHQQEQIRVQLANVIRGVVAQRLIPTIGGGRRAAVELMLATPAIQNLIREQKVYQIDNVISTSYDFGMQTLERALAALVREGVVEMDVAKRYSLKPDELMKQVS